MQTVKEYIMNKIIQNLKLFAFIIVFNVLFSSAQNNDECSKYKSLWFSYKYSYADGLMKLSSPKAFNNVCSTSKCCDGTVQNEMVAVSKLRLQSIAEKHFQLMSGLLMNTSTVTNDYLLTNIDDSKQLLHQMFTNTYSLNYKTHQTFFYDFYDKLKQYTDGKLDNLQTILDNFFADMAERIVGMMILAKKDPDTIRCLANNLMKLDPYQGADKTISTSFLKTYPMARMFVNSLKAANDVFIDLIKAKTSPSWDCAMAFSKAFYCPLCSGSKAKPCENVCKSSVGQCLGALNPKEIARLSKAWVKLLVAMENMSKRLLNPFNLLEINKNLHVKISDAIMNVHNYFPTVREKIWVNCKSQVNRKRRSSDWNSQFPTSQAITDGQSSPNDVDLIKLVKTFTTKLPEMKIHLKKYKSIICADKTSLIVDSTDQCWVGDSEGTPKKSKKENRNLQIDPITLKSINKLNEIASVITLMLDGKNRDPRAFKIEFIPETKKPVVRQDDDTVSTVEGSGETVKEPPKKPVPKPETAQPNEEVVEGSGGTNVDAGKIRNETKIQPSFPKLPEIEPTVVTMKPKEPIKKPVIADDEDLSETTEDNNAKNEPPPIIDGSGKGDNEPRIPILPLITTSTPVITQTEESMRPKVPPMIEKPIEGSGFEAPDDEINKKTDNGIQPRFPSVIEQSTEAPKTIAPITTVSSFIPPQELPGDIPQEIWIPRAMDYDSYGRLVSVTTKTGSSTLAISSLCLILSVILMCTIDYRI